MTDFPGWLQGELDKRGWRQIDLARKLGLPQNYITSQIIGRQLPGPDHCREIANALNLSQEFVFRQAGILSPLPFNSSMYSQWNEIFSQLSDDNKQEMLEFARVKLNRIKPKE